MDDSEELRLEPLNNSGTHASDPGRLALSYPKLRELCPYLWGSQGLLPDEFAALEYHVYWGDSRAAVVVSIRPLLVSAYTDEFDCIALLRFPDWWAYRFGLAIGTPLLTLNTYKREPPFDYDLFLGPRHNSVWNGFTPVIAEFVSDDIVRINHRKQVISSDEWQRTWSMGQSYLVNRPGITRDGRIGFSYAPAHRWSD